MKSSETAKREQWQLGLLPVERWCPSIYAASRTMVASYQEPLEIPEGKQISEQDAEIIWKQNTLTNTANQQQITVTPVPTKNCTLLAKYGTPLYNYVPECSISSLVFKGMVLYYLE